eukprot:3904378-Karenia_brevis.AAC.1
MKVILNMKLANQFKMQDRRIGKNKFNMQPRPKPRLQRAAGHTVQDAGHYAELEPTPKSEPKIAPKTSVQAQGNYADLANGFSALANALSQVVAGAPGQQPAAKPMPTSFRSPKHLLQERLDD